MHCLGNFCAPGVFVTRRILRIAKRIYRIAEKKFLRNHPARF
jgi:hypothetical protein